MATANPDPARPRPGDVPSGLAAETPITPRVERLRALRSAYGALAPSALSDAGREITESGRRLTQRIAQAKRDPGTLAPGELAAIDAHLDAFEGSMRTLARSLPVAQLRSTLPGRLANDRRSVLDLLDLMLGDGIGDGPEFADRIGAVDYLITLLCTHGARRRGIVAHDPTSLTPRLARICANAEAREDDRVSDVESEFYAAAGMSFEELRKEFQRRALRQRKIDLGAVFFAPRALRAIVTYNAALLDRVTDEILESGDWGLVETDAAAEAGSATSGGSVFESERLRRLAATIRRRVRGEPMTDSAEGCIAAALDLESLEPSELEAVVQESVGHVEDPIGTAILIGLLCRSLAILSIELQRLGIAPDDVSEHWVAELDGIFQREIDDRHANDAYRQACALAELRSRFLLAPVAEQLREERSLTQTPVRRTKVAATATGRIGDGEAPADRPLPPLAAPARTVAPDATRAGAQTGTPDARGSSASRPLAHAAAARTAATAATAVSSTATASASRAAPAPRRGRARDLVREALEEDRRGRAKSAMARAPRAALPTTRIASAALVVVALAAAAFFVSTRPGRDLRSIDPDQLGVVSPYLVEGHRNGDGHGPAFVGTLDERWKSLPKDGRQAEAEAIVERLRQHGLEQVMIYDATHAIRIQAIGSQPVRAL